jgi:hypothetical protein
MKRFSRCELTKELVLLFTFGVTILILYSAIPDYYQNFEVQAQLQQLQPSPIIGIKIISPSTGQQVPTGKLTISGTSTDNATTDCTVYADWNNTKPFQTAIATGPGGVNDYSTWTFTYTADYHLIANGTNNLTSKLSCVGDDSNGAGTANLTKSYSVNVIGVTTTTSTNNTAGVTSTSEEVQQQQQQESPTLDSNITTTKENNTATAAEATPPELAPSVSTLSPVPLPPSIEEQEEEEDTTIYWDIE